MQYDKSDNKNTNNQEQNKSVPSDLSNAIFSKNTNSRDKKSKNSSRKNNEKKSSKNETIDATQNGEEQEVENDYEYFAKLVEKYGLTPLSNALIDSTAQGLSNNALFETLLEQEKVVELLHSLPQLDSNELCTHYLLTIIGFYNLYEKTEGLISQENFQEIKESYMDEFRYLDGNLLEASPNLPKVLDLCYQTLKNTSSRCNDLIRDLTEYTELYKAKFPNAKVDHVLFEGTINSLELKKEIQKNNKDEWKIYEYITKKHVRVDTLLEATGTLIKIYDKQNDILKKRDLLLDLQESFYEKFSYINNPELALGYIFSTIKLAEMYMNFNKHKYSFVHTRKIQKFFQKKGVVKNLGCNFNKMTESKLNNLAQKNIPMYKIFKLYINLGMVNYNLLNENDKNYFLKNFLKIQILEDADASPHGIIIKKVEAFYNLYDKVDAKKFLEISSNFINQNHKLLHEIELKMQEYEENKNVENLKAVLKPLASFYDINNVTLGYEEIKVIRRFLKSNNSHMAYLRTRKLLDNAKCLNLTFAFTHNVKCLNIINAFIIEKSDKTYKKIVEIIRKNIGILNKLKKNETFKSVYNKNIKFHLYNIAKAHINTNNYKSAQIIIDDLLQQFEKKNLQKTYVYTRLLKVKSIILARTNREDEALELKEKIKKIRKQIENEAKLL